MARITTTKLAQRITDEASAYLYMESLRWPDGPICPHCDHDKAYFLKPANGISRATRTGSHSQRRLWKCAKCRKQFSVTTGTIFHGSKVSLQIWLFVFFEMAANKNGLAAREVERKYGVAPKTAWFITHRIREAMANRAPHALVGTIVADETWIGGDKKNQHADKRKGAKWSNTKVPVLSLIEAETGEARSQVVANVTSKTLRPIIDANVETKRSVLYTDAANHYTTLGWRFRQHSVVDHSAGQYVNRDGGSTNKAENYFSQLKRSLDGTHHHVSVEHLPRYLAEFDFRYSTRDLSDTERMARLMGQVPGRRISYKRVKGM